VWRLHCLRAGVDRFVPRHASAFEEMHSVVQGRGALRRRLEKMVTSMQVGRELGRYGWAQPAPLPSQGETVLVCTRVSSIVGAQPTNQPTNRGVGGGARSRTRQ
jgi:hypothetical protein